MIKIMLGMLIGMLTSGFLLTGLLEFASGESNQGDFNKETSPIIQNISDVDDIYRKAIVRPLITVSEELEDGQIARYYNDFLIECELNSVD